MLLALPVGLSVGYLLLKMGTDERLLDAACNFFISLPVVVYAMRHSRLFVKPVEVIQNQSEETEKRC
jgi:hypothetical protein